MKRSIDDDCDNYRLARLNNNCHEQLIYVINDKTHEKYKNRK